MVRHEGDVVSAVLTDNNLMADGVALFAAGRSNIGTGGAPSATTLNEAVDLMMSQKLLSDSTKSAGIIPKYLLVPPAIQTSAENLLQGMRDEYTENKIICLVDHRLGDTSDTAWYLLAENAVSLFYLETADKPRISIQPSWEASQLEVKISHDFTAAATDTRRLIYNAGA